MLHLLIIVLIGICVMYCLSNPREYISPAEEDVLDLIVRIESSGTMAEAISHYNLKGDFHDERVAEAFNTKMAQLTPRICFS